MKKKSLLALLALTILTATACGDRIGHSASLSDASSAEEKSISASAKDSAFNSSDAATSASTDDIDSQSSDESTSASSGGTPSAPQEGIIPGNAALPSAVDTQILYEDDESMINNYSLIAVNPGAPFVDFAGNAAANVALNTVGARALINWMLSADVKEMTANFGYDQYSEYLFYLTENGPFSDAAIPAATDETRTIRLSTTTSVNDSGLLAYLLPKFEQAFGYKVEVYAAGTGNTIANAKAGNADLILVHSRQQEEAFIEEGFAAVVDGQESARLTFMYNYFVLCGPSNDPAGVLHCETIQDAFQAIADGGYTFVSLGDGSGTHTKELSLWAEKLGITDHAESFKNYPWYVSTNAGMGTCLAMAEERKGYVLSDKAAYFTFRANGGVMD